MTICCYVASDGLAAVEKYVQIISAFSVFVQVYVYVYEQVISECKRILSQTRACMQFL